MRLPEATRLAELEAENEGVTMAVTFDPFGENEERDDNFEFMPLLTKHIFPHHEIIKVIKPK
jgi:hypothetical protein